MIDACKTGLKHFLPEYLYIVDPNVQFSLEEKKQAGAGKAYFSAATPTLVLKARDQAPMVWAFSNKQCAEGAFVTFDDSGCRLHIIEMKSKLTQTEWAKVMRQLSGMYLTALAACRVLGIIDFQDIICYVAYKEDAMAADKSADPIFIKTFVGRRNPMSGSAEWTAESMDLPLGVRAQIRKGQRDQNHDVDFGLV